MLTVPMVEMALDRPIAFHRNLVDVTGSVQSALMLSQALYWSQRCRDPEGWFWKTTAEWQEETGLTRHEQDADMIGLLHGDLDNDSLPGWMKELPTSEKKRIVQFRIAKQREGPTVPIYFAFDKEFTRYRTLVRPQTPQKEMWKE